MSRHAVELAPDTLAEVGAAERWFAGGSPRAAACFADDLEYALTFWTMPKDLIVSDPEIFSGKPCVRGTRLSVEFLLELAASGATQEQILTRYPQLSSEGLAQAFRYAASLARDEQVWELNIPA